MCPAMEGQHHAHKGTWPMFSRGIQRVRNNLLQPRIQVEACFRAAPRLFHIQGVDTAVEGIASGNLGRIPF